VDELSRLRLRPERLVRLANALVDVVLFIDQLPERGGDAIADRRLTITGGGFNVLAGAARLGLTAAYGGRIGNGPFGQQVARDMAAAGIEIMLPFEGGEDTGFCVGLVEADGERTFVSSPGIEAKLDLRHLEALPLAHADAVCVSGYDLRDPKSGNSVGPWLQQLSSDYLVVIDPGPLVAEIPTSRISDALKRADVLSANSREAATLAGIFDPAAAANYLTRHVAPLGWVIIRTGPDGCWVATAGQPPVHVRPRPTKVVDTTGAGDTYLAALLTRLAANDTVIEAAQWANVAASMAVEKPGGSACPTSSELADAMRLHGLLDQTLNHDAPERHGDAG
jgi:sugar/nucleoside kinase (ribokinase family)